MAKEYIEREAAVKSFNSDTQSKYYQFEVTSRLHSIPAADVRENVRGEWVQHYETTSDNETLPYGWECSLCGRWEMEKQPFCNCGAQMGGAEDGE